MKIAKLLLTAAFASFPLMAQAATTAPAPVSAPDTAIPDLVAFGVGGFDVIPNTPRREAVDFRLENRWGTSLLSAANSSLASWDDSFQLHPFAGVETSSRGQFYGFGGLLADVLLGRHIVISPSIAAGYYAQGDGKKMGCPIEFRSTLEAGWRFDNQVRVMAYGGHTSNAGFGVTNSGAETAGVYLEIPLSTLLGK